MSTIIETIFEKGVFRPLKPLVLPEKMRVKVYLPDESTGVTDRDDDNRPWRGLFVLEPEPSDGQTGTYFQPLPGDLIPRETPAINLSWLRDCTEDE